MDDAAENLDPIDGFPERFRETMKARGLNGVALAQRSGVDTGRISRIVNGKRLDKITALVVVRLARALDVSTDFLLTGKGFPPTASVDVLSEDTASARSLAREIARELIQQGHAPKLSLNEISGSDDDE